MFNYNDYNKETLNQNSYLNTEIQKPLIKDDTDDFKIRFTNLFVVKVDTTKGDEFLKKASNLKSNLIKIKIKLN